MVPVGLILLIMLFFKMIRTVSLIIGFVALWIACVYALPKSLEELSLRQLGIFVTACSGVLAFWVYIFIVRSND